MRSTVVLLVLCGCYESHGLDGGVDSTHVVSDSGVGRLSRFLVAHDVVVEERSLDVPSRVRASFAIRPPADDSRVVSLNPLPGGFLVGWVDPRRVRRLFFHPWADEVVEMPTPFAGGYITHRGDVTYLFGNLRARLDREAGSWSFANVSQGVFGLDSWYYAQGLVARMRTPNDPEVRDEFEIAEFPEHPVRVPESPPARLLVDADGRMSYPNWPEREWFVHAPNGSLIGVYEYPAPTHYPALGHDGTILWVNEDNREIYRAPVTLETYEVLMDIPDDWECPCFVSFAVNALE